MSLVLAFAFGAGLVSPLNPCGFALLPAFFGYQLGSQAQHRDTPLAARLWRALATGGAVSAGFAGVLVSAGLLVALGLRPLLRFVPFAAVVIGVVLVGAGVAVLAGRRISLSGLGRLGALRDSESSSGLLAFGAGYAVASVACTLAILLAVVGQALTTGSFPRMLAVLAAYGAGAATLLTALAVSTAVAGSVLSTRLRRALPFMQPFAGVLLVLSGVYLVATNVRGLRDTSAVRAVSLWFTDASSHAQALIEPVHMLFAPVTLALLLLTAVLFVRRLRARSKTGLGRAAGPPAVEEAADASGAACCNPAKVQPQRSDPESTRRHRAQVTDS